MIETQLRVGMPSPFPVSATVTGGTGAACSSGVTDQTLGGVHYWHLPFVQNGINYVSTQGRDVTSYNFSGCIMAIYTDAGDTRVCHVSTGDGQDCKAAWEVIKSRSKAVFQFKPSDYIETGGQSLLGCYGLITPNLQTLSITVVTDKAGRVNTIANIAKGRLLLRVR